MIRFIALGAGLLLAACGESTMRLESDMKLAGDMKMQGSMDVDGAMRIEGPIEIHMQMHGPSVQYEGVYISEALLDRVDEGKTRQDWILAVFGEPTSRARLDDGSEIWQWAYRPVRQEGSLVTVLSTGGDEEPKVQTATAFVQMKDGVVVEKWRD